MGKRVVDLATGRPLRPVISFIAVPGASGTKVNILMGAGVLGGDYRPPIGTLGIRVRASDLVGLAPPVAALKVLHGLVRTLENIVSTSGGREAPAPPEGVTGAALPLVDGSGELILLAQHTDSEGRILD